MVVAVIRWYIGRGLKLPYTNRKNVDRLTCTLGISVVR